MILKIIVELILALIIIMTGTTFWILLKRDRFLIKAIQDDNLISKLINKQRMNDFNATHQQPISIKKLIGYSERIKIWEDSDRKTQIRLNIFVFFLVLLVIVVSVKISLIILVLNIALFLLTVLVPIGTSGRNNAFNHIMLVASIIDEWIKNNEEECTQWIGKNTKFKKVFNKLRSLS